MSRCTSQKLRFLPIVAYVARGKIANLSAKQPVETVQAFRHLGEKGPHRDAINVEK
jgi:hypothetical protein